MINGISDSVIYVIHALQGYEYQENHVTTLFSEYNLEYEFVTDADPSVADKAMFDEHFTPDIINKTAIGKLSCTLNHILSYKKFLESDKKYALIFENDPFFLSGFEKKLNRVFDEMKNLEPGFIISLENTTLKFPSYFQTKRNKILYRSLVSRMAGAYIIDREAAKNAINDLHSNKCNDIVDWWMIRLIKRDVLKMYWAHPPLTEQGSHNGKFSSTISSKSNTWKRRISWLALKFFKTYVMRLFNQRRVID